MSPADTSKCTECLKDKAIRSFGWKMIDGERHYFDVCIPCKSARDIKERKRNRQEQRNKRKRNANAKRYYHRKKREQERKDYYW